MSGGRPKEDKTREYAAKLKWLDPEKYFNGVKGLDAYGWRDQLAFRRDLIFWAQMYQELAQEEVAAGHEVDHELLEMAGEVPRALFAIVQDTPLVDLDEVRQIWGPRALPTVHSMQAMSSYSHLAVRPTTFEDFYLAEAVANPALVHQAREFFGSLDDSFESLKFCVPHHVHAKRVSDAYWERWHDAHFPDSAPGESELRERQHSYQPWMEEPLHKHGYSAGRTFFSVDISAPDSVLIEEFKRAVTECRASAVRIDMPQLNLSSWGDAGLLPYIDLRAWGLLNNEPEIDRAIIKKAILPFGRREDYIVKSITEPAYDKLMNSSRREFSLLVARVAEEMLLWNAGQGSADAKAS